MKEYKVSANGEGKRLNKFVGGILKEAPSSFVYKMLRKKNITLNDKKATGQELLNEGDIVKIFLSDETFEKFAGAKEKFNQGFKGEVKRKSDAAKNLDIVYKTTDILAVNKPINMLSQKASSNDYSLNEILLDYCKEEKLISSADLEVFKPSVCNRLDKNTSGLVMCGISLKGSKYLSRMFASHNFEKYYIVAVQGNFPKAITETAYIVKDEAKNISKVYDKALDDSSQIKTGFEPIGYSKEGSKLMLTLLKVRLYSGKSHQIRAHLKKLGYSVIGDPKYGDRMINDVAAKEYGLRHQMLHAYQVVLQESDIISKDTVVTAPLPTVFKTVLDKEGVKYGDLEFQRSKR